jgi:hypothetical protein
MTFLSHSSLRKISSFTKVYTINFLYHAVYPHLWSRDSSVGIALGYGLGDRGSTARLSAGAGNFSLQHRIQIGSGAHLASYPMGKRGSFTRGKVAGA